MQFEEMMDRTLGFIACNKKYLYAQSKECPPVCRDPLLTNKSINVFEEMNENSFDNKKKAFVYSSVCLLASRLPVVETRQVDRKRSAQCRRLDTTVDT